MSDTAAEKSSTELMVDLIISLDGYASAEGWAGWVGPGGSRIPGLARGGGREVPIRMGGETCHDG
jgi:hypothetical protein